MAKPTVRGLARRILSRGEARRVSGPRSASGAPLSRFVGFGLSNWRGVHVRAAAGFRELRRHWHGVSWTSRTRV